MTLPPANEPPIGGPALHDGADDQPKVGAKYIWLLIGAQFGVYMALVAPMSYSLTVRIAQLSPGNPEFLGFVSGAGALAAVFAGPLFGMLSDRTRSRLGRRRPWLLGSVLVGLLGLAVVALAGDVWTLGLGWIITQLGLATTLAMLSNSMADRLPESQRGKIAGLNGAATMVAAILGVGVASVLVFSNLALLLVPGVVGVLLVGLFVLLVEEPDSRGALLEGRITVKKVFANYIFDVKRYSDFSWNWLGRFSFNFGLTLTSTFTTFFFAGKLDVPVTEIGGIVAITGFLGVIATVIGAAGSGFLSDKLRRRRGFVLASGLIFGLGTVIMAFAPGGLTVLLIGSFVSNLGLGVFSAVDQALVLDVLPERATEAGRFNGINQFSTTIPQSLAPLLAPAFLAIGAAEGQSNYPLLYLVSAAFAVAGGVVILLRVKSVR
ncbi:MFS transporter [Nonomuraea sp. NPDC050404]|uniref:MFS transporter n=1 Tax=Nonomuraea sp. NPDC050404 TaxID=3155783 RepID=UPI0033E46944